MLPAPIAAGLDKAYALLFGPADLGAVDFAALRRRRRPNDALACPKGFCAARADFEAPVFSVPAARLRAIVREVAAGDGAQLAGSTASQDRFVTRTWLLRFPDTVNAEIVDLGDGRSSLALYSRSQVGVGDFGVNRARVDRWLRRIGEITRADALVKAS